MNEKLGQQLVDREVYYCLSSLVEDCFKAEVLSFDDISQGQKYLLQLHDLEVQCTEEQRGKYLEEYSARLDDIDESIGTLEEEIAALEIELHDTNLASDNWERGEPQYENCLRVIADIEERMETAEGALASFELDKIDIVADIELIENADIEYEEIFEWWLVSDWLAKKLEAYGEPILWDDRITCWGRTTTGQSLSMDYVIQKIAKDIWGDENEN